MDNNKSHFDLKEWNGKFYPLVRRKVGRATIDECPFCGQQHTHGYGVGHRHTHCTDTHGAFKEIIIKGHLISRVSGYFIEEYA